MAVSGLNTPTWRSCSPSEDLKHHFDGQPFTQYFSGLLFDMDGTIIDSTAAIIKHWQSVGEEYGLDPEDILATSHGRRSIDVFQHIDPSRANWDYVCALEAKVPVLFGAHAVAVPGAKRLIGALEEAHAKWAIVTSGTRPLVEGWLKRLGFVEPDVMVTAEQVKRGKPDPACYEMGAEQLGLGNRSSVLVLEDAPAGVRAGKAAGCKVLAVATTHQIEQLVEAGADWVVQDLRSVHVETVDYPTGQLSIGICGTCFDRRKVAA